MLLQYLNRKFLYICTLFIFSVLHIVIQLCVFYSRCIIPHFLDRNAGTFALMSSSAGKAGVPYSGTYTGSKHALHVRNFWEKLFFSWNHLWCFFQGYFESLRTEKMGTGISVTMLCPGPTFSNLLAVAATEKPGEVFWKKPKLFSFYQIDLTNFF